jgi:Family of unknown function (DUF5343)
MQGPAAKMPPPPYTAYKTFKNFLERFKQGVPSRIDRGVMGSMSGANQTQVKTALRYLKLISEHDIPTEKMAGLCKAEGEERKKILKELLTEEYPYVFSDEFDLSSATAAHLRELLEQRTSASGGTIERCVAFLRDAAVDVGIKVSPFIQQRRPRGTGPRKRNGTPRKQAEPPFDEPEALAQNPPSGLAHGHSQKAPAAEAQSSLLLWGLFQRLPKPGTIFSKADREHWMRTLEHVFTLEYLDQE